VSVFTFRGLSADIENQPNRYLPKYVSVRKKRTIFLAIPFDSPVDDFDLVIIHSTSGGYGTNSAHCSSVPVRNRRRACGRQRSEKSRPLRAGRYTVEGDVFASRRDAEMTTFVLIVPLCRQL
jgi:hypothetical protein